MLVICEDCAKKYSIDEQRIKAPKVKFHCRACNHIIIVEKPKSTQKPESEAADNRDDNPDNSLSSSEQKEQPSTVETDPSTVGIVDTDEKKEKEEQTVNPSATKPFKPSKPSKSSSAIRAALRHSAAASGKGVPCFVYLLTVIVTGLFLLIAFFVHLHLNTLPDLLEHQLELRSLALTQSLQGTVLSPLARKDYLTVNKEVQRMSKLPGVAYAAVGNNKGIIIAGFFNNLNKFDNNFAQKIKEKGFQADILIQNTLPPDKKWAGAKVEVGGIPIYDQITVLPDGGALHLGLHVDELDHFSKALLSPFTLILLLLFFLAACIILVLLNKLITQPMRTLTNVANRISLGELDLAIIATGPREIRELGAALERMRHSIKVAMERLS
ncbi:MAG: HAMP domain-containing protein [Candidatus Electrothrix sp. LOE1_4_5]|nr:HAMP domain-containing protein [Candidatus Electrothrix gigas]